MSTYSPLKAVVVGCHMGGGHAEAMAKLPEFQLAAVCDLNKEDAKKIAVKTGNPAIYTDYVKMLTEVKPDVVSIATPNKLHYPMALQAIEAGVKGIYCEKPIAVDMGEGRKMLDACQSNGVALIVGHQRRMTATFRTMRRLITDGAIGDIYLIRGACPGDFLSDGTHTVDTIFFLNGDTEAEWVFGQVHRQKFDKVTNAEQTGFNVSGGYRFGHAIEDGAMAIVKFKNGVRAEIFTGDMKVEGWNLPYPGWAYQDIEVFGTKGRLWRNGDAADPQIQMFDQNGGWKAVELEPEADVGDYANVFKTFADYVKNGGDHPMSGVKALRTHEVIMAMYESARLRDKVILPLKQEKYPLGIMVDEGLI